MHKVEVNIFETEGFQTLVKILFHPRMVRAPQLSSHKDIFSPNFAAGKYIPEPQAHLFFIAIAICSIDMPVPIFKRVFDGSTGFSRFGLPCPYNRF